ncbi:hypothetical protein ACWDUM_19140 [Rhodococcus sp. NPDC003322]
MFVAVTAGALSACSGDTETPSAPATATIAADGVITVPPPKSTLPTATFGETQRIPSTGFAVGGRTMYDLGVHRGQRRLVQMSALLPAGRAHTDPTAQTVTTFDSISILLSSNRTH